MTKKQALRIAAFFLTLLLLLSGTSYFFNNQNIANTLRFRGFELEEKDSLDVVIIGASDILRAYLPGEAYEEAGFTSYLMSYQALPITGWRPLVKKIIQTQKPQLILLEPHAIINDEESYATVHLRKVLDNMPLSGTKLKVINRVVPEEEKESYLLPLLKYHENWQNFSYCAEVLRQEIQNRRRGFTLLRGAMQSVNVAPAEGNYMDIRGDYTTKSLMADNAFYLQDFILYCQSQGINVLLIRAPHRTRQNDTAYQYMNEAAIIAGDLGSGMANFEYYKEDMGLDYNKDFSDDEHVNVTGAEKFTRFMARYLVENGYVTPKDHGEKVNAQWAETVEATRKYVALCKEHLARDNYENISETNIDLDSDPPKVIYNRVMDEVWE